MDKLFLAILNMSLTGAFVIAATCLVRVPLKKAPKTISYCLWAVAGFRLVFPFSIESVFSLIPFKAQTIPLDIAMQPIPRIDSGIPFVNNAVSSILPAAEPAASVNPLQVWTAIGAWGWIIGAIALLIYGVVSFFILKQKMSGAVQAETNIYEAENIKSPFVLGVFKPKIYLPVGLSEQEKSYIILHEQTHIRRHDHIVKFAAYFVLCLHWFNPLVWVAFLLLSADMEMSCDERVLKEMGGDTKKDYSLSLLSLATERRVINGSPLAFGEGGIKERVKNVLNFKRPSRVVIIAAVAFVAVLSVGFLANQVNNNYDFVSQSANQIANNKDFISQSANQVASNKDFTPQTVYQVTINKAFTPQTVKLLLEKYLPSEVWDNLPDFREETLDDGSILYLWSEVDNEGGFIHKIMFVVENDEAQFYHYQPYLFDPGFQQGKLNMQQAYDLVKAFAKDFIVKGEELVFINRPAYYSLYDPGNVESWVAVRDGIEYIVMVHLNGMDLIFFMASPMMPEDIAANVVWEHYPNAEDVHLSFDETLDMGGIQVAAYMFDVLFPDGEMIRCAVSKDTGLFLDDYSPQETAT